MGLRQSKPMASHLSESKPFEELTPSSPTLSFGLADYMKEELVSYEWGDWFDPHWHLHPDLLMTGLKWGTQHSLVPQSCQGAAVANSSPWDQQTRNPEHKQLGHTSPSQVQCLPLVWDLGHFAFSGPAKVWAQKLLGDPRKRKFPDAYLEAHLPKGSCILCENPRERPCRHTLRSPLPLAPILQMIDLEHQFAGPSLSRRPEFILSTPYVVTTFAQDIEERRKRDTLVLVPALSSFWCAAMGPLLQSPLWLCGSVDTARPPPMVLVAHLTGECPGIARAWPTYSRETSLTICPGLHPPLPQDMSPSLLQPPWKRLCCDCHLLHTCFYLPRGPENVALFLRRPKIWHHCSLAHWRSSGTFTSVILSTWKL